MDRYVLGWSYDSTLERCAQKNECIARVIQRYKNRYRAVFDNGQELNLYLPGKILKELSPDQFPVVGDWCSVSKSRFIDKENETAALIESLVQRKSKIVRLAAGEEYKEQVLAANVDLAFIVNSVNSNFNLNRIRRFIALCRSGQVEPIVVLSKIDLVTLDQLEEFELMVKEEFSQVRVVLVSMYEPAGIHALKGYLNVGTTAVFLGSSGVGKSTLVNQILKREAAKTSAIRDSDSRGRHTTTGTSMFFLPEGGIIIDTPGIREVGMAGSMEEFSETAVSVNDFAQYCKFRDCGHNGEPGCRVNEAVANDELSAKEFKHFRQLAREVAYSKRKSDKRLADKEKKRWKKIKMNNRRNNRRG